MTTPRTCAYCTYAQLSNLGSRLKAKCTLTGKTVSSNMHGCALWAEPPTPRNLQAILKGVSK